MRQPRILPYAKKPLLAPRSSVARSNAFDDCRSSFGPALDFASGLCARRFEPNADEPSKDDIRRGIRDIKATQVDSSLQKYPGRNSEIPSTSGAPMRISGRVSVSVLSCTFTLIAACSSSGTTPRGSVGAGAGTGAGGGSGTTLIGAGGNASLPEIDGGSGTTSCVCDASDPNANCNKKIPPGCGDGIIEAGEQCDDGNSMPGDGCSGTCQIEPNYVCPTPGQPCVSTVVCGDGVVGPGEGCDDGNSVSSDGCSSICQIEPGYVCKTPGQLCTRVYLCGDGVVDPNEGCDDGNSVSSDGCSARCQVEAGYKCSGSPSVCTHTICGDGKVEGAESCDDGNTIPFDGCGETCQAEPSCPTTGPCTSVCGDGIVLGANEQCDDGNLRDGDGCSHDCQIEPGFVCDNDVPCDPTNGLCSMTVASIFRDFNFHDSPGGHPDFQPGNDSGFSVVKGLVQKTWDSEKKPVLTTGNATCISTDGKTSSSCTPLTAYIHGADTFAQWYRDGAPSSGPIPGGIKLWDNGKGGYVNRFGPNGEQFVGYPTGTPSGSTVTYPSAQWCATIANGGCTAPGCVTPTFTVAPGTQCIPRCIPNNDLTYACYATEILYDGNPLFFPIDPPNAKILTDKRMSAKVPEQYGFNGWPWEKDVGPEIGLTTSGVQCDASDPNPTSNWCHNFSFTTEVKYWFKYDATQTATLDFTGDDDVWVFLNGQLAVDLGGWHVPLDGSVTLDSTTAPTFDLQNGQVYEVGVFQTERETQGSTFRLTLSGFSMTPSTCHADCGDGVVAAGEQCDDGTADNTGDYNHCNPDCTLGPRCGDGVVQTADGEQCDDGKNLGLYNGCAPSCQLGPRCGDGVVQSQYEQCDNGVNDGSYGTCNPDCTLAPYCGDGIVNGPEQCDSGGKVSNDPCSNHVSADGCTDTCQYAVFN